MRLLDDVIVFLFSCGGGVKTKNQIVTYNN